MSQIKTQGLVIKACNLNDNDKILTVLTRDSGIITAISKGIRSQKHKDFSALQLFCYSDMVIEKRTGLGYVSSAAVINNFFEIRECVEKVSLAAYIADLANSLPQGECYDELFYNFILNMLYSISKTKTDKLLIHNILRLKTIFEFKFCCESGYLPQTDECALCGSVKKLKYFDTYEGCVICDDCIDKTDGSAMIKIDETGVRMVDFLCKGDLKTVFKFDCDDETLNLLTYASQMYLQCCTELAPATLEYLNGVVNGAN